MKGREGGNGLCEMLGIKGGYWIRILLIQMCCSCWGPVERGGEEIWAEEFGGDDVLLG